MGKAVLRRMEEGICYLTLNRPQRLNAMDLSLLEGLLEGLQGAAAEGARVVAIEGVGRAFSAGADLVEFYRAEDTPAFVYRVAKVLNSVIAEIRRTDLPVVALVKGAAVGAGFSLALACDLTAASEGSVFNLGYMRVAFSPDGGATLLLPRLLGLKRSMELCLLTEDLPASRAQALGLVNFLFPEEEFEGRSRELLLRLRDLPPKAVAFTKRLLNDALLPELEAHMERERQGVTTLAAEEAFRERLEGFLKGRS